MEIPENLQKIKIEHPSSPEKSPQNNIKERLHLHVKRRLNATTEEIGLDTSTNTNTNTNKQSEKQKEPKTKRPYQKRSEKVNTKTSTDEEGRKNKRHKSKNSAIVSEESANVGSVYDDDEINDADTKTTGRDKDKYPDVLNMVLSVKKRALMQHPEVNEFFTKLMNEIKS